MRPVILREAVEGHHALPVAAQRLGGLRKELAVATDELIAKPLAFGASLSVGHLAQQLLRLRPHLLLVFASGAVAGSPLAYLSPVDHAYRHSFGDSTPSQVSVVTRRRPPNLFPAGVLACTRRRPTSRRAGEVCPI